MKRQASRAEFMQKFNSQSAFIWVCAFSRLCTGIHMRMLLTWKQRAIYRMHDPCDSILDNQGGSLHKSSHTMPQMLYAQKRACPCKAMDPCTHTWCQEQPPWQCQCACGMRPEAVQAQQHHRMLWLGMTGRTLLLKQHDPAGGARLCSKQALWLQMSGTQQCIDRFRRSGT